ncbi:hypothetical protein CYY_001454 [Polysphondylium violaceum]|uniref:Uncharacterized protein n=1 Tax=Polysphondylium violaceum TaxID=133409 RepID=A0A8J4V1M7_9MYCE|nr:hypothetical protein CYY_001454 [Polysphondylium violaceum]
MKHNRRVTTLVLFLFLSTILESFVNAVNIDTLNSNNKVNNNNNVDNNNNNNNNNINSKQQQQQPPTPTPTPPYIDELYQSIYQHMESLPSVDKEGFLKRLGIELPPVNFTFDVNNSSVNLPMSIIADKLNISDVRMYSPSVVFPLTFQSTNMTYEIALQSQNLPMTLNLSPNGSEVPISLSIQGSNSIPVTLHLDRLETPLLNYIIIGLLSGLIFICLAINVYQQISINSLKKRLDRIDISDQVLYGKRYKQGNTWYCSINNQDPHLNNNNNNNSNNMNMNNNNINTIVDDVLEIRPSSPNINNNSINNQQNNQTLSNHCIMCTSCGITIIINGKTRFCFQCGNSIIRNN